MLQKTRFDGSAISGINYGDWTRAAYEVSYLHKIKGVIKVFAQSPVLTISAVAFRFLIKFVPYDKDPLVKSGMWQTVQSSKKAINI